MDSISIKDAPGKELLVRKIDENAKWTPHHTFLRYPAANWETEGYRGLTCRQFADGINKVAHWLDKTLGKSLDNETIAYLGANDIRYAYLWPALNKTNRKFLVPDGRITKEGLASLLKVSDCKVWLYAEEEKDNIGDLGLEEADIKLLPFPSLEWCLDSDGAAHYPYYKSFEDAKYDEVIIIHTSGTTGPPKPIFINNKCSHEVVGSGFWAASTSGHLLSRIHWPRGVSTDIYYGRSLILACPMRWSAGIGAVLLYGVYHSAACVLPPGDVSGLPPDLFLKMLRYNRVDGMLSPPHTIVELFNDERTNGPLKALEFITYVGASLDRAIGDVLCEHTKINVTIGATETGGRPSLHPINRKLWYTLDFVPECNHRFVRLEGSGPAGDGSEDLYELFLDRPSGPDPSIFQSAFWNFKMYKDVDTIDVKELWAPVKDSDGTTRWEFKARSDDLLKLEWLAKFHAHDIETRICGYPGIKHVLVGGEGRPAPYVIIELKDELLENKSAEELLDDIYNQTVVGANKADVGEIRIPKETVFLAKKEKPFKLSLKQLVMRRAMEDDYAEEIEAAYESLEKANSA